MPNANVIAEDDHFAFQYQLGARMRIGAGTDNIRKQDPPLMADLQVQADTDAARRDASGRRFFLSLRRRFGN